MKKRISGTAAFLFVVLCAAAFFGCQPGGAAPDGTTETAGTGTAATETASVNTGEQAEKDGCSLRLLQFNIQTENGNPAPFEVRSEMYRKFVDEILPDVVGMQEVTPRWRRYLDTVVFGDAYDSVGERRSDRSGGEANPIYYRKDRFELVNSGTFWLSDTPEEVGSRTEGANAPRVCTWTVLKDKESGTLFAHMNTHLDHRGKNDAETAAAVREAQAAVLVRFAAQKFADMPLFLTGDLNCGRSDGKGGITAVYQMITGGREVPGEDGTPYRLALADSRFDAPVTVDEKHTATLTKYYGGTGKGAAREPIDYVFYSPAGVEAHSYQTFLISENDVWISDHLPVFATFRIQNAS